MKKLFLEADIDKYNKIMLLLGLKETKRKKTLFKNTYLLTYKKEKEINNFDALKERYMPSSVIPFFFVILLAIIAVAFATTFLILNIVNKDLDKLLYFFLLMIPTFLATLGATGVSIYRYFSELKNIEKIAAIPLLEKEVSK